MNESRARNKNIYMFCVMAVICIFAIAALILLNVAIRVYKNIAVNNLETYELRTSLSYVATKIHQGDVSGNISVTLHDGTSVLVIRDAQSTDEGENYETVIYYDDGAVCELYHLEGEDYTLSDGLQIIDVASFGIYMNDDGSILLTAGDSSGSVESMYVAVHSVN